MTAPRKPWLPPGPVSSRFYAARDFLSVIMGPVGSAKTTTVLRKIMMLANYQDPSPVDAIRRSKWRVVRDTYKNVKSTSFKTWKKIVPHDSPATKRYAEGGPADAAVHEVQWTHPLDGRPVLLDMEFVGLGELTAENSMSSWEGTGIYYNELNLMDEDAFLQGITRVGRYPGDEHGQATCPCILADLNAPPVTDWTYKLISRIQSGRLEELLRQFGLDPADMLNDWHSKLAGFYRQPGGRAAGAENVENLPKNYYARQVGLFLLADREDLVITKVDNEFGPTRDGKPVYKRWKDSRHVAGRELQPLADVQVVVGADAGLNPSAILMQETPTGQIIVLDELVPEDGDTWDAEEYAERLMRLRRSPKYRDLKFIGYADPASRSANAAAKDKKSWLAIVEANTDFIWKTASTNDIPTRLSAVRHALTRDLSGEPGFLLSATCEVLREGFNSGYKFAKRSEGYGETPEKNRFSHAHDGLQYGCMGIGLHYDVQAKNRPTQHQQIYKAKSSFKIHGGRR
ncbi:hypothetical protein [Magnetospirillum sulfuroxidans]|uniref:Terminase n=1 Tax=Magnetospirillum sulfuroxidans TaxID=611300 RepID=A0ABS5I8U0_9PROT|nr:hypothetical protein [Magnetospirillum sulfuroxidans]MBR9970820.1 hypothetical protein [Magnetospirillum sulfuroxidans]